MAGTAIARGSLATSERTAAASGRGGSTPKETLALPSQRRVFSQSSLILSSAVFQKCYLCLVTNRPAAMNTDHPERQQPGKVLLGSDRMRHQRGPLSSEAVGVTVLQPLSKLAFHWPGTLPPTDSQVHSKTRSLPLPPATRCRSTHPRFVLLLRRERWGLKRQSPTCSE